MSVSIERFSTREAMDYVGKSKGMLVMELNANGESSQITEVSQRTLYSYIKAVVSYFEQHSTTHTPDDQPEVPNAIFAEPVHSRDLRKLRQPFSSQNQPSVMVISLTFHASMIHRSLITKKNTHNVNITGQATCYSIELRSVKNYHLA
jgi:hypothetical protein